MQHLRSLQDLSLQKTWLTIGIFDGVHRGHQKIIRALVEGAKRAKASALVVSFYPRPAIVLGKKMNLKTLTLPDEKAELLAEYGVDVLLTHPFNAQVAAQSPETFMQSIRERVQLDKLLIGYDFALGKNRQGDAAYLQKMGEKDGYTVQRYKAIADEDDGQIISSRRIRQALTDGRVRDAHWLLGHPYTLRGSVVHGDGRGRKINIPTANIAAPLEKALPANGVYACWVNVAGKKHPAVTNVGIRPTFTPDKAEANVEAHLLDFDGDLYDQELTLSFVEYLRAEKKFNGVEELLAQIRTDIAKARQVLV